MSEPNDPFDQALSRRLRRLDALPVDTARLEKGVKAYFPGPKWFPKLALTPLRALAAGLALAILGVLGTLLVAGRPAVASAEQMARLHRDLSAGRVEATQVDSMEAANQVLSRQSVGAPDLPDVPATHVMACCMKEVRDRQVALVLLKRDGVPVTLSVTRAGQMRLPAGETRTRHGVRYVLHSSGAVNMISGVRDGRWICLMGEVSFERLIELAEQLRF